MEKSDILQGVQEIVRDAVDDEDVVLTRMTSAADVPGWDSVTHIRIIMAVEKRFGVRFLGEEIESIEDVGQMVDLVSTHLGR